MVRKGNQVIGFWDQAQSTRHDILACTEFRNDMCEFAKKMEENGNLDLDFKKYMLWIASEHEKFVNPDIAANTDFHNDMREYARKLEENVDSDLDFKKYMQCIEAEVDKFEPYKKRKDFPDDINNHERDSDAETEDDPQYKLFLENLKECGSSYAVECEEDGSCVIIPYEVDIHPDDDCDKEPRRKLNSGIIQEHELQDWDIHGEDDFNSTPVKQMETQAQRNSRNQDKSEHVKNTVKCFTENMVLETDYHRHIQTFRIVDDHIVARYGDHTIVYHKDGKNGYKEEEFDDGSFSDVEIVDKDAFYKLTQGSSENMPYEFRRSLIAVLKKPYDKEEYDRLCKDIEFCRPLSHYKNIRGGKEYMSEMNNGKSYLDDYPDLRLTLLQFEDYVPKCLNILRGFFFWLLNLAWDGSFIPWNDKECLSTRPEP